MARLVRVFGVLVLVACSSGDDGDVVPTPEDVTEVAGTGNDIPKDEGATGTDETPGPGATDGDVVDDCVCESAADCTEEITELCLEWGCVQCRCEKVAMADGTECDDTNLCTENDQCTEGTCGGTDKDCDDGQPCTDDSCSGLQGCVNAPVEDQACDDGNECTTGDKCAFGVCVPGVSVCDEICDNLVDDDGDQAVDCDDDECAAELHCLGQCLPAEEPLGCGSSVPINLSGVGGAQNVGSWSCAGGEFPGYEWAWTLKVEEAAVEATVSLSTPTSGVALMHVASGSACGSSGCVASGSSAVVFDALPGSEHTVVVDTTEQLTGTVDLSVSCAACTPKCESKQCGPDGCGGSCGSCAAGFECVSTGLCLELAENDTCAAAKPLEGDLPVIIEETTELGTDDYSLASGSGCPGSDDKSMGFGAPDLVYSFVPFEASEYLIALEADFNAALYVVTDCGNVVGSCVGASNGVTGDEQIITPLELGVKHYIIVDAFAGGADGPFRLTINTWPCAADCVGKACGADGCGGTCGGCNPGFECKDGQCFEAALNDTCASALGVNEAPWSVTHQTTTATDDFFVLPEVCPGGPALAEGGQGAADLVYAFTAPENGKWGATVSPAGDFDALLFVSETCPPLQSNCVAGSDKPGDEDVAFVLSAGETAYVVVDGATEGESGTFDLSFSKLPCTPSCLGKACGADGCGGECGPGCGDGQVCTVTGACAEVPENDTCDNAKVISSLPYSDTGNTVGAGNDYEVGPGVCVDGPSAATEGAGNDVAYVYTAPTSQKVVFEFDDLGTDFNTYLYTTSGCLSLTNCKAAPNSALPGAESVVLDMVAGQTVFVLVDGWSKASQGNYLFKASLF